MNGISTEASTNIKPSICKVFIVGVCVLLGAALVGCGDSDEARQNQSPADDDGLSSDCVDDCRDQGLAISYGGEAGEFERAVYGLSAPEVSDSGMWELYIEAVDGGFEGCPRQDSASPRWTLIIAGLPMALDDAAYAVGDDELTLTFLDFDGRFLGNEPFVRATSGEINAVAANIDPEVSESGEGDDDGVVALEIAADFDGNGEVSGHLVATHCASMDVLAP